MVKPVAVSGLVRVPLKFFELVSSEAGRYLTPAEVDWRGALPFSCPGTVASALDRAGKLSLSSPPDLDGSDHWLRTRLPEQMPDGELKLVFEGLATFAEIWVDGACLANTDHMFVRHVVDIRASSGGSRELALCFRALTPRLATRRARPRWRTRLVEAQQLRFVRTSLIGRTPGFCPRIPAIGPFREVYVEGWAGVQVISAEVRPRVEGRGGSLSIDLRARVPPDLRTTQATVRLRGPGGEADALVSGSYEHGELHLAGIVQVAEIRRWWPHTHGDQPRSRCTIQLEDGTDIDLGQVGFRSVRADHGEDGRGFGVNVNETPIFCRGAVWTTDDLLTLGDSGLLATLRAVRDAGMNMLRVAGIACYEGETFYELCDELGILVFQDFMFANMDYPIGDAAFRSQVEREARERLEALAARPCLAVVCGGSEVAQQVAMLGMPRELWGGPLFEEVLPAIVEQVVPTVPYVPSSPWGGDLPFQVNEGVGHYYGVGAYLRPLEDARRADVRFAAECLAFANIPERATIERLLPDLEAPAHHPRWKERVPRDRGASWDFEDVRDHYVRTLFAVDPLTVRYQDMDRYLALGRVAVCEVMEATFAEWRRAGSRCRGALVFWLKDYWDGAGWGVIDARGIPKAPYFGLRRALQPVWVGFTDEGVNGLVLHAANELPQGLSAELGLTLYRAGELAIAQTEQRVELAPRSVTAVAVERAFGRFVDSAFAYRFGPPSHDLVCATLRVGGEVLARAFHLPLGRARAVEGALGLTARVERRGGVPGVVVGTTRFAQHVHLDVEGLSPIDNYFHLEPCAERWIGLQVAADAQVRVRGTMGALNSSVSVQFSERS